MLPLAGVAVGTSIARTAGHRTKHASSAQSAAPATTQTLLLMTTRTGDVSGQADTMALVAAGGSQAPYVLLVPTGVLTQIPGYGFDAAGRALSFGRVALAQVSVENMVGVRVDHTAVLTDAALAGLVDAMGGIDVAVSDALYSPDKTGRLVPVFTSGAQHLSGAKAVAYLTYQAQTETELSRLERQQQVWEAMFARFSGSRSGDLARLVSGTVKDLDGNVTPDDLGQFLAKVAAPAPGARTYDDLPVEPVGAAQEQTFRVSDADLVDQVQRFLADVRTGDGTSRPRLQLLNGNGTPEIGLAAASKLVPAGFHLIDGGNARSFDYTTKIVVYADDAASMAMAQKVRALLGLGEIEVSLRGQTSVDVTVVIGKDYHPA